MKELEPEALELKDPELKMNLFLCKKKKIGENKGCSSGP